MSCISDNTKLAAWLVAATVFALPAINAFAQTTPSAKRMNPYLADCYQNVTYLGQVGHHFSITLPHTRSCRIQPLHIPPGLSLRGCDIEGAPNAPGRWTFDVLLEAKCQGIDFGELQIPITIIITE